MSLHDIDKNNGGRIVPTPNSNDDVMQRMAQGTGQVQNSGEEETDGLRFQERQILAVQDGVNKAAFGFYGAANKFGLKVAEDGTDVLEAEDDQLIFNSDQNVFKIVSSGTTSITSPSITNSAVGYYSDSNTVTINHDLGYIPIVLAFRSYSTVNVPIPGYGLIQSDSSARNSDWLYISATSTQVKINVLVEQMIFSAGSETQGGNTYSIKYYLLQETAN